MVASTPEESPFMRHFMGALKKHGQHRVKLMKAIPGQEFNKYEALFLQYSFENEVDQELRSLARHNLNDRELDAWADLHRMLSMDVYVKHASTSCSRGGGEGRP